MLSLVLALALASDDISVSVLTFGPGDHPFFKFGHNAVWVHDDANKQDLVYNYGMFAFDTPLLIPEFLKGKLLYWVATDALPNTIAGYRYEHRTMTAQKLALSQEEARGVADALALNALPENKYYKYDYYLDNCSTRVRDVVDTALRGAVHEASRAPAEMTWRMHTRRLTQDDLPEYLGLDIVMGDFIDKPINQWDEMFLPSKLQEGLRRATRNGEPIVETEREILRAPGRAPMPTAPPRWHLWFLLTGTVLGSLWFVRRLRLPMRLIGGTFGLLGCIFVMFWVATDHQVAHGNENIYQCAPWAVALYGLGRKHAQRAAKIAASAAAFALLGAVLKVLPMMDQVNWEFICFFVPFWACAAIALKRERV